MTCLTETNNPQDSRAVLVHNAGRMAGRVPRGLCDLIWECIDRGQLRRTSVFFMGQMVHDGPTQGGGPKLLYMYVLEFSRETDLPEIAARIRPFVDNDNIFL